MNDNIHVILQALSKMFKAELVLVSSLAHKRDIDRHIEKLSVEKLRGGMIIGGVFFYDFIKSKITISQGGTETEYLCKKYLGGKFLQLYGYEVQLIWDDDGFMLCINSPREDAIFETRHSEYLASHFDVDVKEWLAKLEKSYQ